MPPACGWRSASAHAPATRWAPPPHRSTRPPLRRSPAIAPAGPRISSTSSAAPPTPPTPPAAATTARYRAAGAAYLKHPKRRPASVAHHPQERALYDQSVMVLAASEDKANRGAYVASPTMPWVWGTLTLAKT